MAKATKPNLKIMVSSTVYGIEPTLNQVYSLLDGFGYEVWMSLMGTIPNWSGNHAFEDCLQAVKECDLFLSIITPQYGSGVVAGQPGITHQELDLAISRKVPRWVMAHERVTLARSFFKKLGHHTINQRTDFLNSLGFDDPAERKKMLNRESKVIDDFRVIDMYDLATRQSIANILKRSGNWVQGYKSDEDIRRYITAQFHDYGRISNAISSIHRAKKKASKKKARPHK